MQCLRAAVAVVLAVLMCLQLVGSFRFANRLPRFALRIDQRRSHLLSSKTSSIWAEAFDDEEDLETFQRITQNYLTNKFQACVNDNCHFIRSKEAAKELLAEVLPPVTPQELEEEVRSVFANLSGDEVSVAEFVHAVADNSYWRAAGPMVVQEVVYLDCVYSTYYHKERAPLLANDDYDELKAALVWQGSAVATISNKEALFLSAVAAFHRNKHKPLLSESDYAALKRALQQENSWVVKRQQDALEKLGLDTFLSYLHRAL